MLTPSNPAVRAALLEVIGKIPDTKAWTESDVADQSGLEYNQAVIEMDIMSREYVIDRRVHDGEMWVRGLRKTG